MSHPFHVAIVMLVEKSLDSSLPSFAAKMILMVAVPIIVVVSMHLNVFVADPVSLSVVVAAAVVPTEALHVVSIDSRRQWWHYYNSIHIGHKYRYTIAQQVVIEDKVASDML